jgi:predicted AAA+ superfamily ATPase
VGKTTLMKQLKTHLDSQKAKTLFLNLDIENDAQFFTSQERLLQKIKLEIGNNGFVFIDEIQKKENAGVFLKGIYDMDIPYKFIISGSGSLELKEKIHESLAGRKRMFECFPISFSEFVNFKTDYVYQSALQDFFALETEKTLNYLREYLNFGGYPRIVVETEMAEKRQIIDEIFKSYVAKDIAHLMRIDREDAFVLMLKILASQAGQLANYAKLSREIGISEPTLKNYLWYAVNTFALKQVSPFFRNKQKEILKAQTFYFNDLGLRNYTIGLMGYLDNPANLGFVFQNFVYKLLYEKYCSTNVQIKFWRTTDQAEVDFILEDGEKIIPLEVKYTHFQKPEISRSLRSFCEKYTPKEAILVNLNFTGEIKI